MDSIFHRTSIRKFLDKDVEPEKVEMLLKAAMAAPSAGNQQPWEFYIIKDRGTLLKLSACSPYAGCAGNAPMAVAACYHDNLKFPEYAHIDMSACTENLLLEADALGLGVVWLGIAPLKERMDKVKAVLELPEGTECFALIPCGYPAQVGEQQDRYDRARVHFIL